MSDAQSCRTRKNEHIPEVQRSAEAPSIRLLSFFVAHASRMPSLDMPGLTEVFSFLFELEHFLGSSDQHQCTYRIFIRILGCTLCSWKKRSTDV